MTNEKIIDSIDTILYKPSYTGKKPFERFYRPYKDETNNTYYKFENETVTLLKGLFEKLSSPEKKEFFLSNLKPIGLPMMLIPSGKKRTKYTSNNQDFIFMLYLKIGKTEEAFHLLQPGKSISKNTTKILYALLEFITFEWCNLPEEQLDTLLKNIEQFQVFIRNFDNFNSRKKISLDGQKFTPSWNEENESNYKYSDANAIYESRQILGNLKGAIYKIKKCVLSSYILEGINLEVNQDQNQVKMLIANFGFSKELNESIDKINQKLHNANDPFDFKGCIDLIRTFFNDLCISVALKVEKDKSIKHSETINEFGKAMSYFRKKDVKFLDDSEDKFITSFNGLLSDKGIHSLTSEKEYARISKNVAIETGLFLLERLQKINI